MLAKGIYWMLVFGCVLLVDHLYAGLTASLLAVWSELSG